MLGTFIAAGTVSAGVLAYALWRLVTDKTESAPVLSPRLALAGLVIGGAIALALLISSDESAAPVPAAAATPADLYPGPWRDDYRADIQRALAAAGAGACLFHYRASATSPGEFLAYCPATDTRGGRAYLVWPAIARADGPFRLSADIPAPQ